MEVSKLDLVRNTSENFGNTQMQTQSSDVITRSTDSSKVWRYLGATATLIAAGIGIGYAIKRGKVQNLDIANFKQLGKFEKGKALLNNGKTYTGTINVANSKGNFAIEYVNGVLKSSTKTNATSGLVETVKIYPSDGGVITKEFDNAGKVISKKFSSKETGKAFIKQKQAAKEAEKLRATKKAQADAKWQETLKNLQKQDEFNFKIGQDLCHVDSHILGKPNIYSQKALTDKIDAFSFVYGDAPTESLKKGFGMIRGHFAKDYNGFGELGHKNPFEAYFNTIKKFNRAEFKQSQELFSLNGIFKGNQTEFAHKAIDFALANPAYKDTVLAGLKGSTNDGKILQWINEAKSGIMGDSFKWWHDSRLTC